MKLKFFTLFAAFTLLFGSKAMAQTNGDVNGDGKVDEQDITAIIQIMQEAGGVKEPTKYYWYAGWTIPTAENIATIINETYPSAKGSTTMNPAGKTATSTSGIIMDYTVANLYNANAKAQYYFVVPNGQGIYDILGTKLHLDDAAFTVHSSTAIANHTIYISTPTGRTISAIIR